MAAITTTGAILRATRKSLGISQARLSEITNIPQHYISAFELGKSNLNNYQVETIEQAIVNIRTYDHVIGRKKRYRHHTYNWTHNREREAFYIPSSNNSHYLSELQDLSNPSEATFSGISLFSGIGGLSKGFQRAGCKIKGYLEISEALSTIYEKNFPGTHRLGGDIAGVDSQRLENFLGTYGPIDCVIGGPPCQGFSLSGKRDVEDPRNYLFEQYFRVIAATKPKVAIIENVRLLTSMRSRSGGFIKDEILSGFRALGYLARMFEVNAKSYGVPQHRERVFFVAAHESLNKHPSFPEPEFTDTPDLFGDTERVRTFADACSDLSFLESGERSSDPLHWAVSHPQHVIEWLWNVEQGASAHDNIDPSLRPPSGYNTTYKRQHWSEPASTVQTTFGMISGCRNVHPIATRALTIREAARLQSFPDDFEFVGPIGAIRTGIGNAVPPLLAKRVARHISSNILDLIEVPGL